MDHRLLQKACYTDDEREKYCKRIKLLRHMHHMNQTEFSDFLGLAYKKWNHYERGYPVSRETLFVLRIKIAFMSADWLYWGDTRALSAGTLQQMHAIEQQYMHRYKPIVHRPMSKVRRYIPKREKQRA